MDKKYAIQCPRCRGRIKATLHPLQKGGIAVEYGKGKCPGCDLLMNLKYDPVTDTLKARDWNDYEQEVKARIAKKEMEACENGYRRS